MPNSVENRLSPIIGRPPSGQGAENATPMVDLSGPTTCRRPRHLIADSEDPGPHFQGWMKLAAFLAANPDASAAYNQQVVNQPFRPADPASVPTRRPAAMVEAHGRVTRDAQRAALLDRMANAAPEARSALVDLAITLHTSIERRAFRRSDLRRFHRAYACDLSDNAACDIILRDIARRTGSAIITTGNNERDRLIDAIILCGKIPSARSIRRDLAP